jgi:hypothetical protein
MRNLVIYCLFLVLFSACSDRRGVNPEDVGEQVFGMLQSVPKSDMNDYFSNFISLEEIHAMAQDETLVKNLSTRRRMASMTQLDWNALIIEDRTAVLERGLVKGVVWEDIEFEDFQYEVTEKEGIKGVDGELLFSSEEKTFAVTVRALWDGTAYRLSVVEELDEVGKWPR